MLTFDRVGKRFPGVAALTDVTFTVAAGECHALLGENGAGKSTLGKIAAGIYRPDEGRLLLDGRAVQFHSPRDAALAGVGMVHQELVFCPNLSVAENLCLHDLPRRGARLDRRELRRRAEEMLRQIGLELDVDRPLDSLSIAQEQMVQIAAAVGLGARVLVFDEPTSSLGGAETERLFALIRRLQVAGTTIVYVSHRMEEIFALCQRVTVLRDGRLVATRRIEEVHRDELVRLMVGRDVDDFVAPPVAPPGEVRLRVRGFTSPGKFAGIDLDVRRGEIVGLAGLVGAGRSEIAAALLGLDPHARGEVTLDGRPLGRLSPGRRIAGGLALVPEDRKRQGLVQSMNVRENLTLPFLNRFRGRVGIVRRGEERRQAEAAMRRLAIRAPGTETAVAALSGGNQQKIVLAKGTAAGASVLIVDEPTRGVDVGAKREIHELLARLAAEGAAILLISSDLPELLDLSHRVAVLRQGRIAAELTRAEATPEAVLRHMAGVAE